MDFKIEVQEIDGRRIYYYDVSELKPKQANIFIDRIKQQFRQKKARENNAIK